MSKTLVTIKADSANEMYRKLTQAQTVIALMSDATQEVKGSLENEVVNNAMWLLSDLLRDTSTELSKREYLTGGNND